MRLGQFIMEFGAETIEFTDPTHPILINANLGMALSLMIALTVTPRLALRLMKQGYGRCKPQCPTITIAAPRQRPAPWPSLPTTLPAATCSTA